MNYQNASISELIQARDVAYIEGSALYDALATLVVATEELYSIQDELEDVKRELSSLEEKTINFESYVSFFDECFERLDGHYPCPSVTSDYDCSVIFDAISGIE